MSQTIHLFVEDSSFVNKSTQVAPVLASDSNAILSTKLLNNFLSPYRLRDPRGARLSGLNLPMQNTLAVVTDQSPSVSSFVGDYTTNWSTPDQSQLFNLIDEIIFAYTTNLTAAQMDTTLQSNTSLFRIYQAGSLSYSPHNTQASVYLTSSPDQITVPYNAQFNIVLTDTIGGAVEYTIVLWVNGPYFELNYPVSNITAVIPPLTYTDLLNKSLTTLTDNAMLIGKESSSVSLQDLQALVPSNTTLTALTEGASGILAYSAKFIDPAGNYIFMPFNILYKGRAPGILPTREAIRVAILASGVGTQTEWQARIPELFINAQFYLLPVWTNTTTLPNSVIYPDITPVNTLIAQAEAVFFDMPTTFVTANLQILEAIYNGVNMSVVPDQANPTNRVSLLNEHPTYQALQTTDPKFAQMATLTKQFAINLNNALPVANGDSTNNAFSTQSIDQPTTNLQRNFVTFTVGDVEYFVLTSETLSNILAKPPGN